MNTNHKLTRVTGATEVLINAGPTRVLAIIPETAPSNSSLTLRDAATIGSGNTPIATINALTASQLRGGQTFEANGFMVGQGLAVTIGTTTTDAWLVVWNNG